MLVTLFTAEPVRSFNMLLHMVCCPFQMVDLQSRIKKVSFGMIVQHLHINWHLLMLCVCQVSSEKEDLQTNLDVYKEHQNQLAQEVLFCRGRLFRIQLCAERLAVCFGSTWYNYTIQTYYAKQRYLSWLDSRAVHSIHYFLAKNERSKVSNCDTETSFGQKSLSYCSID